MKNIRSSQPCISMNFCTESNSAMWVSLMYATLGALCYVSRPFNLTWATYFIEKKMLRKVLWKFRQMLLLFINATDNKKAILFVNIAKLICQ